MDGLRGTFGGADRHDADTGPVGGPAASRPRGRDSLFLTATIRLGDDPTVEEVRIRNLSAGGMMAEYPGRIAIGTRATLELRGIGQVVGQVAWCTQGRLGIALDRPIDPRRARKPVAGGAAPAHAGGVSVTVPKR